MKKTVIHIMLATTVSQVAFTTVAFAEPQPVNPSPAPVRTPVPGPVRTPTPAPAPAAAAQAPAGAASLKLNVGDTLQLSLPNEPSFSQPFKVDREGRIELPEVGGVDVLNLTVPQAKERISAVLSTAYRDVSKFSLVLKERKLLLTVLGFVKAPGNVELPAGSNVQQALIQAGGLVQGAQLDRLQLHRMGPNGTVISVFDFKKYLDTGESAALPQLQPLDEIFVPASPATGNVQVEYDPKQLMSAGDAADDKSSLRVFGEVSTQGSFSWKEGMRVMDAIMRAGGVTRYAGVEQIKVLMPGEPRTFNLKHFTETNDEQLNFLLPREATIFVPAAVEQVKMGKRVVYAMGEIAKPGAYETQSGASFFDILANAGGPTRFANTKQVRIIRSNGKVDTFDLSDYTENGRGSIPAMGGGDAIFIPEKTSDGEQKSWLRTPSERVVRVMGSVRAPGRIEWSDEMSILDLLAQVGGPNEKADISKVQILGGDGKPLQFNLQEFLDKGGLASALPKLTGNTTISVPELPQSPTDERATWTRLGVDRAIHVFGSVGKPGRYAITPEMSFIDLLSACDGPTTNADLLNIRINHRGEGHDRPEKVNIARYFETGDDSLLPKVRPGDVVFVPDRNRNWLEQSTTSTVRVLGAVGKPGRYQITEGMTILDLLAEAGGPSANALQSKIVVANMTAGADAASTFDLPDFARSGDFRKLPVVRAGDTVYVPNIEQDDWNIFFNDFKDIISVLAVIAVLKGL